MMSAEKMLDGAESISRHYHVSPWILGFIVVGFGTSAPELTVSTIAAFSGEIDIAVGNAIGSNIANLTFILGVSLLACKTISGSISGKPLLVLLGVTLLPLLVLFDHRLQLTEGLLLLSLLLAIVFWVVRGGGLGLSTADTLKPKEAATVRPTLAWVWLSLGMAVLLLSSEVSVNSAVEVAEILGINSVFVGLTIISLGTSLPELAVSLSAARRGNSEIILGNIFGSNMFNSLGVIGVSALINHDNVASELLDRDTVYMIGVTALTAVLLWLCRHRLVSGKVCGTMLLALYPLYLLLLYNHAFA